MVSFLLRHACKHGTGHRVPHAALDAGRGHLGCAAAEEEEPGGFPYT